MKLKRLDAWADKVPPMEVEAALYTILNREYTRTGEEFSSLREMVIKFMSMKIISAEEVNILAGYKMFEEIE